MQGKNGKGRKRKEERDRQVKWLYVYFTERCLIIEDKGRVKTRK